MNHDPLFGLRFIVVAMFIVFLSAMSDVAKADEGKCGPYDGLTISADSLDILKDGKLTRSHSEWLEKYSSIEERSSYPAQTDPLRANFCGANAQGLSFFVQDLSWADFTKADLRRTNFNGADVQSANFTDAKLEDAKFVGTKMSGVFFGGADLTGVRFEPDAAYLPNLIAIRRARGLESMRFSEHPDALIELRESFKKAGRRDLERQITYAVERSRTILAWEGGNPVEAGFRYIAWDIPTRYGLAPHRAITALIILTVLFSFLYMYALSKQDSVKIWRVYPKDRIGTDGQDIQEPVAAIGFRRILVAYHFSLLSAFQIGWRELNFGNWIARLQLTEYSMRSTGWVRVVAGTQSLLSVYLLAMWALTFFGRPFDG
jgi:hypothetical protein